MGFRREAQKVFFGRWFSREGGCWVMSHCCFWVWGDLVTVPSSQCPRQRLLCPITFCSPGEGRELAEHPGPGPAPRASGFVPKSWG